MNILIVPLRFIKRHTVLLAVLLTPIIIYAFTIDRYYGFAYDSHYFHLLAWDLLEKLRFYVYIGCHASIQSSLFSYILYPFFVIFGQNNLSVQLVSALFHLANVFVCFKLGERFYHRNFGLIFAFLVALSPFYILNVYMFMEYTFLSFLNCLSIYYFLVGFEEKSPWKLILSSFLYFMSCFSGLYSLPLFLFFAVYSLTKIFLYIKNKPENLTVNYLRAYKFLYLFFYPMAIIAFLYLVLLLEAIHIQQGKFLYYIFISIFLLLMWLGFKKLSKSTREILKFCSIFIVIAGMLLLLSDLFVQLDMNLFNQKFGYYRDTSYQFWRDFFGTGREILYVKGQEVKILGENIYSSVLNSLFSFTGKDYTRHARGIAEIYRSMQYCYKNLIPLPINIFMIIGTIGLGIDILLKKYKKIALSVKQIFPLIWTLSMPLTFINISQWPGRKLYLMPFPYLFAALGICYSAWFIRYINDNFIKIRFKNPQIITTTTMVSLTIFLNLNQVVFLKQEVLDRYINNKAKDEFAVFYKSTYYRNYKEVGEFLLKDAPLKKDGKFRSIFIYTIRPQHFFNTIDWYTHKQIKIIYALRHQSSVLYGSRLSLYLYLSQLFFDDPNIQAIYFGDVYDSWLNSAFFSEIYPEIKPYTVISNGNPSIFDCILYKFERNTWRQQLPRP